jgi:hypothetical protein
MPYSKPKLLLFTEVVFMHQVKQRSEFNELCLMILLSCIKGWVKIVLHLSHEVVEVDVQFRVDIISEIQHQYHI